MKKILSIFLVIIVLFSVCSCWKNNLANNIKVSWLDADGKLIDTSYIDSIDKFEERQLPLDTSEWVYTDWKIVSSGDVIICMAQRVKKNHYVWKNYDGTVIKEITSTTEKQEAPELPVSTNKWVYNEWGKEVIDDKIVFTAQRTPNKRYFIGNVFQIVLKDDKNKPISTGSGFIINDDGWFITNNHVMDGGVSAVAYFDIEDNDTQQQYIQLSVIGGVYNSEEKDIFIGKLSNYEKIKEYYQSIAFVQEYSIGEKTYTVGYPNSSLFMQINQGTLLEEYTDIYGKIYNSYYLLSDSYIAPGSSGGILINEDFEIIGITSMGLYDNQNTYLAGGSVPTCLFYDNLKNLDESNIKSINEIY